MMTEPNAESLPLVIESLSKAYPGVDGGIDVQVLSDVSLTLKRGASAAIVGPSGCGKTTLLNVAGTLDLPSSGRVLIEGQDVATLSENKRAEMRANKIGFVFQEHHLLPQCSAIENVLIPTLAKGVKQKDAGKRAVELLQRVGLSERINHRPDALSGGQRQRVAIVRALINRPALLLVDEPTGALDSDTADRIMDLLIELNKAEQTAMLMVTHAPTLAARVDRTFTLNQGKLTDGATA